ncbi:MAG: FAD-dependent oxidoreductase [Pseudomonadota bacterium]
MTQVVVIGAGQAGASCVAKLRSEGFDGAITLIGEEPVPPYQRPPLSKKYLLGEMELERLFLRPEAYYAEQSITLRLSTRVDAINVEAKTVQIGDEQLAYDELVIATGSAPRRLPAAIGGELDGVYLVRDLADADAMAPEFVEGARVLIVGGGYIGLEAAAVAASKGLNATLVEMEDRILKRVACAETAAYFRDLHSGRGVDVLEGVGLKTLTGDGRVSGAELTNGQQLELDFVIVGIGIAPAVGLAEAAGVKIENGIVVDEFGRTSNPNIWAAGDCAYFPYRGGLIRLESVPNAIEEAEAVAANICGAETPYLAKPWFWSDQFDVKLQIAGLNTGYDDVVSRGEGASMSFWYFKGDELLAVDAANAPRDYMIGKRLIEAGKTLPKSAAGDPDAALKDYLR